MWQVNLKKLALWLLPTFLRQPLITAFVLAASWPIREKYNDFISFTDAKMYRLQHNSQVCYLRAVLNDAFDFSQRRIQIVDFVGLQKLYLWPDGDDRDIDISNDNPVYLWPDDAYSDSGIDFTVEIPATICTSDSDLAYLKSLLNEYKTPGKSYNIKRI